MTRARSILPGALAIIALATLTNAQQPTRDGGGSAGIRTGTGILAGLVTLGDDARTPVRRAIVTQTAADGSETLAAISEENGRFAIRQVPAGRYTLEARKPAHLPIAYGARRPGRRGTILIVTDGQRVNDLTVLLPRGAVLAGRVTLPDGQPLANVQLMAIPAWLATARGRPEAEAREFRTDDLGEFRLFGLMPDTYVVAALPSFGQGEVERMSTGAISGVLRQLQQPGSPSAVTDGAPAKVTYAPTYFPGTPSVGNAARVTVAAGEVREGLNFTITAFPASTIRGRVVGIDGAPTPLAVISLEAIGPAFPAGASASARIESPKRNGEFQIAGVSPGLYRLRARAGGVTVNANGRSVTQPDSQTQYAMTEINVSGTDINGLALALREGHRFSGTVTVTGSVTPPALTGITLDVEPLTASGDNGLAGVLTPGVPTRWAAVDAEGRFTVTGLESFEYEIRVKLPPPMMNAGWRIDSIRSAGRDLRDAPLTFAAGSLNGVEIRLTTSVTELSGRLTTESGTPATDYFIVAFPADRTLWHSASPRVRVLRPAVDGSLSTRDLPAGTYRLAVLTDVDDRELRQQAFLESIYDASIAVSLAPGQTTRQELRVGRRPN